MMRRVLVATALGLGIPMGTPAVHAAGTVPAMDRQTVEGIVRDYLRAHPEIVIDALERFRKKQEEDEAARTRTAIDQRWSEIQNHLGAPDRA